jgi:hypothetical protein
MFFLFLFLFVVQTAYIDVCDDTDYSRRAKSFMSRALAAIVPAITTTGIYPGVSNGDTLFLQYSYACHLIVRIICSGLY